MGMYNGKSAAEWYSLYSQAIVTHQTEQSTVEVNGIHLRSCPFCGRTDLLSFEPYPEGGFLGIRCRGCGCIGPSKTSETETEAAIRWNARP